MMVLLKEIFENVNFENRQQMAENHEKICSMQRV